MLLIGKYWARSGISIGLHWPLGSVFSRIPKTTGRYMYFKAYDEPEVGFIYTSVHWAWVVTYRRLWAPGALHTSPCWGCHSASCRCSTTSGRDIRTPPPFPSSPWNIPRSWRSFRGGAARRWGCCYTWPGTGLLSDSQWLVWRWMAFLSLRRWPVVWGTLAPPSQWP